MAFQSVPSAAEVVIRWQQNGVVCTNTFYGFRPGYEGDALQDLADAMDEFVGEEVLPFWTTSTAYLGTVVRGLQEENDLVREATAEAAFGTSAQAPLPNNVALAVTRTSAFTGRSARGRIYWGGFGASNLDTDENRIGGTYASGLVDMLNLVRTVFTSAGWTEVIVSRRNAGELRDPAIVFIVQEYRLFDNILDSQRGRLPR